MIIFQSEDQSAVTNVKNNPEVIVYDNSNIQKSCNGVTTPLTFSFTKRVYASVLKETLKKLSVSDKSLLKNEDLFQNLVGLIKGRVYYNINNWYRGLQSFNSFSQNKLSLSQIMGLSEPVNFIDDKVKSWWQRCIVLWGRFIDLPRLLIAFASLRTKISSFLDIMQKFRSEFYCKNFDAMCIQDLKKAKNKLDKMLINHWDTPVINDLYVLMASGNVAERLEKSGLNNPQEFVSSFLTEEQALANLQPAKHLHRLAISATYYPELKLLINRLPDDIDAQIKIRFKDFYKEVIQFIDVYGDKTTGELKLETQTMRSNPLIFYGYLRDCLNAQISEIRASNQSKQIALKTLEQKLSHLSLTQKRRILSKVNKLQQAIAYRELFKLEQTRVLGMYRTLYSRFGVVFQQMNWIQECSDIFYLTEEEIVSCGNGREHIYDTLIATRKQEFELYKAESVPSRVFVSTVINTIAKEEPAVPIIQTFDAAKVEVA